MALIKSISGIRGIVGGSPGEGLTPLDIATFSAAYGTWLRRKNPGKEVAVVVGRDARMSGDMANRLVTGTLIGLGIDVVDLGLSTTPTVAVSVPFHKALGGIITTASHNPEGWNGLKLLNEWGEFISPVDARRVLELAEEGDCHFAQADDLGRVESDDLAIERHIDRVLGLPLVDVESVKAAHFKVVLDAVNSTGGMAVPPLLERLGVQVELLYCNPNGRFPHNPEPLAEHLQDISRRVVETGAHMGIAVDPDVDRLAFLCENGLPFGEEYTLVAVADYVLQHQRGKAVSNLSSSRALRDVAQKHGREYLPAAVGEVYVVEKMKAHRAVIGGEGNGGVIYPEAHYGRDALVGIALFLTHLAKKGQRLSELRASYPAYYMVKKKVRLAPDLDMDSMLKALEVTFEGESITTIDGLRIDFTESWVHLRQSNTEPVVRVYAEGRSAEAAEKLAAEMVVKVGQMADMQGDRIV